jgi:hypothetical protein
MHCLFTAPVHDEPVHSLSAISVSGSTTIVLAEVNPGNVHRNWPASPSDRPSDLPRAIALQRTARM